MEAEEAIFNALKAMYEADTGTGGLNNTSSSNSARVTTFMRRDDPRRTPPGPTPRVEVEIITRDISPFGDAGGTASSDIENQLVTDSIINLHLVCHRDLGATQRDAIRNRMRIVFWRREPNGSGGWSHSRLNRLSGGMGPPGDETTHWVDRFRLISRYQVPA